MRSLSDPTIDSQFSALPIAIFDAADQPAAPTITDPINGQTISAATYTATISAPTLAASEWRTVADSAGAPNPAIVYQTSGVLEEPTRRTYTFAFPVNNRTEHLQARIRKDGLWSEWATSVNPISYTPPAAPLVATAPDEDNGALTITITNPAPGAGVPAVAYNDVWIDDLDGRGWIRKATMLPTNSTWTYWTPRSGVETGVKVVAVAVNGTSAEGVAP